MYNLLIAIAIAAVAFALGTVTVGSWIAGVVPAVLALGIAWFLLARRTAAQLQALMDQVTVALKRQRLDEARRLLEGGRRLGRWQFLVGAQMDAQLGALAYMERDFRKARPHLEKAFSRDWSAQSLLAALDFREHHVDAAVKRLEKVSTFARKEAIYWGLYAYILLESKRREEAMAVLARGLKVLPSSEALKSMQISVSNDKKVRMKAFGQAWYTFFPEQIPVRRMQVAPPGRGYPPPRR